MYAFVLHVVMHAYSYSRLLLTTHTHTRTLVYVHIMSPQGRRNGSECGRSNNNADPTFTLGNVVDHDHPPQALIPPATPTPAAITTIESGSESGRESESKSEGESTPGSSTMPVAVPPTVFLMMVPSKDAAETAATRRARVHMSAEGELPAGLRLDPSSGVISGTPTEVANVTVTVLVKCSGVPSSTTIDLTVAAGPPLIEM